MAEQVITATRGWTNTEEHMHAAVGLFKSAVNSAIPAAKCIHTYLLILGTEILHCIPLWRAARLVPLRFA